MKVCCQELENQAGKKFMDPISNMIIMIKNASLAGKESVSFPYSKMKNAIAECLKKEGYAKQVSKKTKKGFPVLEVELVYNNKTPKITEVERISKQSRRVYFQMKDIHSVRNGSGMLVLSTPKGILSGKEARKEQVGGEALFKVW
jgi:small subunit ribosomal protein S8